VDILRLTLLGLAALIAISLGLSFLFEAQRPSDSAAPTTSSSTSLLPASESLLPERQKIEAEISAASPNYARFFAQLKALLPNEYDEILNRFAKRAIDGEDVSNVDALLSQAVRDLRISNGVLAAKADGPALSHIFDMQLQMMQVLAAKDSRLCVDFLYGGASQAFFAFSAQNRKLVSDMAIAGLDAISSGQTNKIERQTPTDIDFNELESDLKAQDLSEIEIDAILDGKTPDSPIPDDRMCTVGQIYLKTLATLPEPERLRIYGLAVELMARS